MNCKGNGWCSNCRNPDCDYWLQFWLDDYQRTQIQTNGYWPACEPVLQAMIVEMKELKHRKVHNRGETMYLPIEEDQQ